MTDQLLDEVRAFLADLTSDLTNLHVKAMQYQNSPYDDAAVRALAAIPAGLLDRAQALAAEIGERDDGGEDAPKAKPAAARAKAKPARRSH